MFIFEFAVVSTVMPKPQKVRTYFVIFFQIKKMIIKKSMSGFMLHSSYKNKRQTKPKIKRNSSSYVLYVFIYFRKEDSCLY